MTGNQKKIIRKLQWIFYPVVILLIIDFVVKFIRQEPLAATTKSNALFAWIDKGIMIVVFVLMAFVVLALMQQFFTKAPAQTKNTQDAAAAKLLLKIEMPNQLAGSIILFVVALGFCGFVNLILFLPETVFEQRQIDQFETFEKFIFGFFYVLVHFLAIVFGKRLFTGMPPVFMATEKGFCYEPAGISTGWILWQDIEEVRESSVLSGSGINKGPSLVPVLGIKLINPEEYNAAAYAPLLQRIVKAGQQLNNYQTEGVGDILLNPVDFGNDYEKVRALFKEKAKTTFNYHALAE